MWQLAHAGMYGSNTVVMLAIVGSLLLQPEIFGALFQTLAEHK
jgi:hypothetical protein